MADNTYEKKGTSKVKARISSLDLHNQENKCENTISSSDLDARRTNKIKIGNDVTINSSDIYKRSKKK